MDGRVLSATYSIPSLLNGMFNCSSGFRSYVSSYRIICLSIGDIKGEKNELKSKVSTLTKEILRLKDLVQQQRSGAAPSVACVAGAWKC